MKRIAVIGGGLTGLTIAKELKGRFEVDIFEKDTELGGIASTFQLDGVRLEKYYHHIFKTDNYIVDLIKELGLEDKLDWFDSTMGFFADGRIYEFGTPVSLLKFRPLSLIDKVRFGFSIINIKLNNNWKKLENISAKEWLIKNAGEQAYRVIWEPLLKTKFGDRYETISMAWMWGKIKLRGSSKDKGGSKEKLGYMIGSYGLLIDRLRDTAAGSGNVYTGSEVQQITRNSNKYSVFANQKEYPGYDAVVSTLAYPIFTKIADSILEQGCKDRLNSIKYTSTRCMILVLENSFMPVYWLNIGDVSIPFGGLIEHTNLVDSSVYGNKNILYISNYMFSGDRLYNCTDEELLEEYAGHLKKVNRDFEKSWVKDMYVFKDDYAQPMITKNYSDAIPQLSTPVQGLYTAAMPQIYPEDRGMNYAIRLGKEAAQEIYRQMGGQQ